MMTHVGGIPDTCIVPGAIGLECTMILDLCVLRKIIQGVPLVINLNTDVGVVATDQRKATITGAKVE